MNETPARWYEIQQLSVDVPSHVVFRALANETVLLNIRTGRYHGIDPVGARFFAVLREAPSVSAACDQLASEYDQELPRIRGDLTVFAEEMQELGLIDYRQPSRSRP